MFITSPDKFASWFKSEVPGAYREITSQDIRNMTDCGLIGRHGFYLRQDLETVRAVLEYEQLRQNRQNRDEIVDAEGRIHCRRCGKLITTKQSRKKGRRREYCDGCEPFRVRERNEKYRNKRQVNSC
jgi:hypothetical protein